jgi:hypothetical protein
VRPRPRNGILRPLLMDASLEILIVLMLKDMNGFLSNILLKYGSDFKYFKNIPPPRGVAAPAVCSPICLKTDPCFHNTFEKANIFHNQHNPKVQRTVIE